MPIPEKRCEKKDPHEPHRWSSATSPGTSFCEGVWRPSTYEEQRALFDRYHAGREYVIDGVLHSGPYTPPRPNTSAIDESIEHEEMDPACKYYEGSKIGGFFSLPSRIVFGIICNECRTLGKEHARG